MSGDLHYEPPPIRHVFLVNLRYCFLIKFSKKKFYILDRHREGWEVLSHVAMVNSDFWIIIVVNCGSKPSID